MPRKRKPPAEPDEKLMVLAQAIHELRKRDKEAAHRYVPLPALAEAHKSDAFARLVLGGNRSGKTTWGAMEVRWWATETHPWLKTPSQAKILCVENTWSLIGDPLWTKLSGRGGLKLAAGADTDPILPAREINEVVWEKSGQEIPRRVKLKSGSVIDFQSADAGREKFEGREYDLVWIDEELADEAVFQEIVRGLVDRSGRLIWTATPLARGIPLFKLYHMAQDPQAPFKVFLASISLLDNPHVSEEAKQIFIATIPEEYVQTRVHGRLLALSGLVYGELSRDVHMLPASFGKELRPEWPRIIGIDPGYADPCAVLWFAVVPETVFGRATLVAYREYYRREKLISEVAADIAGLSHNEPVVTITIDPDSLKKTMATRQSVFVQLTEALRNSKMINSRTKGPITLTLPGRDLTGGIYAVKELLKCDGFGRPGFRYVQGLTNFEREAGLYMWRQESALHGVPPEPLDKNNHAMDVWRHVVEVTRRMLEVEVGETRSPEMVRSARIAQQVKAMQQRRRGVSEGVIRVGGW